MEKEYKYMVCTRCFTFNHAPYIVDAMNGFSTQETTFPVVTVIVDDASTDGEQDVIRKYLDEHFQEPYRTEETDYAHIVCANHRTNPNCQFVVFLLKYNHHSIRTPKAPYLKEWLDNAKYIALCEGDDYWTDHKKLQKQVTFLEEHHEYNVCSHDYKKYFDKEKRFVNDSVFSDFFKRSVILAPYFDYSLDTYFNNWYIRTLTCIYRNGEYLNKIPRDKYRFHRDDIFYYYLLKQGKGALLRDVMGVYRIHAGGVWSSTQIEVRIEASAYNAYNIFQVEKDERALYKVKNLLVSLLVFQIREKNYQQFFKSLKKYSRLLAMRDMLFILFRVSMVLIKAHLKKSVSKLYQ